MRAGAEHLFADGVVRGEDTARLRKRLQPALQRIGSGPGASHEAVEAFPGKFDAPFECVAPLPAPGR